MSQAGAAGGSKSDVGGSKSDVVKQRPEKVRAVILQKISQVAEAERNLLLRSTNCAAGQIDKIYQNVEAIWQKLGLELYRHLL